MTLPNMEEAVLMVERRWLVLGVYHHGRELAHMVRPELPVALRWDATALSDSHRVPVKLYLPLHLAHLNAAIFAVVQSPLWRQRPYGLVGMLQAWDECLERVGSLERLVYLVRAGRRLAVLEAWELGER